jgi:serine/threonine-protein kinase
MSAALILLAIVSILAIVAAHRWWGRGPTRIVQERYRLERVIGRGGTGAVYAARDLRLNRTVAVKLVPAGLLSDAGARRRFGSDAETLASLRHPSIVSIFDHGSFEGGAFLVMELVRGMDLRQALQRQGRIEAVRAIAILSDVCAAIEAAHRQGLLHCDLKPENIVLSGDGSAVKVLDFGVAPILSDERGGGGAATIVGTPAYMAPEQLRAAPVDARTDVFSLGVIAYEMLSGELPFGGGSLGEIGMAQARGARPMPAGVVPPALDRAVRAALDLEPDRRPPTAQAFAHLLAAAADA